MTTRRLFLAGAASLIAAPAIVHADNIMKLWVPPKPKVILRLQAKNAMGEWIDTNLSYEDGRLALASNDIFALMSKSIIDTPGFLA